MTPECLAALPPQVSQRKICPQAGNLSYPVSSGSTQRDSSVKQASGLRLSPKDDEGEYFYRNSIVFGASGNYLIQLVIVPQTFYLPYHVEQAHRKTAFSFYIGLNCPKIKGKLILLTCFLNLVEWVLIEPGEKSRVGSIYQC